MTTTALPLAAERTTRRSGQARAEAMAAYVLSAPAIVCLLGILILPTLATVVLSFTDWQFGAPTLRWIGLDNYAHLAADRVFWKSLGNTVLYVAVVVPVSVGLGLGVALLIEAGTLGPRLLSRGLLPARHGDPDRHGDGVGDHAPSQHRPRST